MEKTMTVDAIGKRFRKYSLWLVVALSLTALPMMNYYCGRVMMPSLLVPVAFSLLMNEAYVSAWTITARKAPARLSLFYMAASGLRLFLSALVVLVFCLIYRGCPEVIPFVVLFLSYYIALLALECIFFVRIEKQRKNQ